MRPQWGPVLVDVVNVAQLDVRALVNEGLRDLLDGEVPGQRDPVGFRVGVPVRFAELCAVNDPSARLDVSGGG